MDICPRYFPDQVEGEGMERPDLAIMEQTILQVEDDPNDVFLFGYAMKKAGVRNPIQVAADGREAIDYLKGSGRFANRQKYPLPALILLDLKLPHVMGLEVLKWIRAQPGERRVVVILSASAHELDIASAYQLGANGYLIKPSEASKLQEMAKSIKDFWLSFNTRPNAQPALPPATDSAASVPAVISTEHKAESSVTEPHFRLGTSGQFRQAPKAFSF